MSTGKIKTLFSDIEKTEALFPRTKTKAISDDDGVGLEALLSNLTYTDEESKESEVVPIDADTLGGILAKDYATQNFVKEEVLKIQTGGEVDLSEFATKEDLSALTADDVGALPISGGTMAGNVNMDGYQITGFAEPNGATQAATKKYVDAGLSTKASLINGGTYTGDLNVLGEGGVPNNSIVWVTPETVNVPYGDWGFVETWQSQVGAEIQRYTSLQGITYVRTHYHNGISIDWHDGWQRIDSLGKQDAITGLTNSMVMICNANGEITTSSTISTSELANLDGVTSNIQTQLDARYKMRGTRNSDSTVTDLNNLTELGAYWIQCAGMTNTPFGDNASGKFGHLEVINSGSGILQRFSQYGSNGIVAVYERDNVNGWKTTWTRVDAIPNKMTIGTEYKTQEMWNGKVVWTVIADLGTCPTGETTVNTSFTATGIVRWDGNDCIYESARNDKYLYTKRVSIVSGKVTVIVIKGTMLSSSKEYCQVWYTKD